MSWNGDFQSRYVMFLDILGFKNKIKNASDNGRLFAYLVNLPRHLGNLAQQPENRWMEADVQCAAFADCIVISALERQHSPAPLIPVVSIAKTLFWEFIERKAVIRGGLVKGLLYHRKQIVFGQAMSDAVDLEKNVALFSRIVSTRQIANDWRGYWGHNPAASPQTGTKYEKTVTALIMSIYSISRRETGLTTIRMQHFNEADLCSRQC